MSEFVKYEKQNGVAHIVLNSPPANAMSPDVVRQLDEAVRKAQTDQDVRAVLFRSAVDKMFMAGADLKYLLSLKEEEFRQYIKTAQDGYNRIEALPKPTIAVLSGHTLGGGCELALSCDFRFISDSRATIEVPEVKLGLLPGAGGTQRLTRLVGRSKATELLLQGNTLKATEALAIGLVNRVFPADQLLPESIKFAEELAQEATQAIGRIKECLRVPFQEALSEGLAQEMEGIAFLFVHTQDAKEGIAAFNEKRPPKYVGR